MPKNVFTRFIAIWKPDFIKKFSADYKNQIGTTWGFWFFWNTIIAFIIAGYYLVVVGHFAKDFTNEIPKGEFILKDGKLSTKDVKEPVFIKEGGVVFIIDTQGEKYKDDALDKYEKGIFINSEKLISKQGAFDNRTVKFSEAKEDITLSKEKIQDWLKENRTWLYSTGMLVIFVCVWIFICLFRLLFALWWALLAWIVALIAKIDELETFPKVYMVILNLYIIPLIIETTLFTVLFRISVPFSTLAIFAALIALNFNKMKEPQVPTPITTPEIKK